MAQQLPTFGDDLPVTREALTFAARHHEGQRRESDGAPYILHPLEVAHVLNTHAYPDRVVAAGLLHDLLERTDTRAADLEAQFGFEITTLVRAVSEPSDQGGYRDRKARLRAEVARSSGDAVAVFAADKLARARELRLELVRRTGDGRGPWKERIEHYWASLLVVEGRFGHPPLAREVRFALEALALLPPAASAQPAAAAAGLA